MRTITKNIYTFDELSDDAKETALASFRNDGNDYYGWGSESLESIKAFCEKFNVTLENWCVSPWQPFDYKHNANNKNFRGLKLRDVDREEFPTGYCLDNDLMYTFCDEFKRTGDALYAFDQAIYAGFKAWRDDWEAFYDDENLADFISANEYEFDEDGNRV